MSISGSIIDNLLLSQASELDDLSIDISIPKTIETFEVETVVDTATIHSDSSDFFGENEHDGKNKISRCILTFFPPHASPDWLSPDMFFAEPQQHINIWVSQFEKCPETTKLHVHVYVEFNNNYRPRFNTIKQLFQRHGFEVSIRLSKRNNNRQRQGGVNYCSHPEKRATDLDVKEAFFWKYNNPLVKFDPTFVTSKANDKKRKADQVEEQRQYIESRPIFWSWDQIVHETNESKKLLATCSWGKSYHAGRYAEIGRRTLKEVIIMYGAGGTGKTTLTMDYNKEQDPNKETRYYRRNPDDGAFWGGGRTAYKGQSVIHFEEFTGNEPFSRLKEVCDLGKPGPSVNVKNGGIELNHDTVIFTSNVHPAGWYHNLWSKDPKQFHPFWRRVTKILFFPSHREDGSLNIPDENTPPFFIDQTNDWKHMEGDYNECLQHAESHWPLKLEEPSPFAPGFNPPRNGGGVPLNC